MGGSHYIWIMEFKLTSEFEPMGDQPKAIEQLAAGVNAGETGQVLLGATGTGKTFIASGLVYEAVKTGYKAYFKSMEELISILRLKEMTSKAMNAYNRLLKAHLVAIDDIMLFPIKKQDAVAFFNLIDNGVLPLDIPSMTTVAPLGSEVNVTVWSVPLMTPAQPVRNILKIEIVKSDLII